MKGKIAVITGCHWCPYKAFDSGRRGDIEVKDVTLVENDIELEEANEIIEIAYCGYHKVGYDGSQIRIENALSIQTEEGVIMPENPIDMPDGCPLPEGDDKSKHKNINDE